MNRRPGPFRCALVLVLSLTLVPVAAGSLRAGAPEAEREARKHHQNAETRFRAGLFAEALAEYQAGYEVMSLPGFLINIAQCYRRLGDLRMARGTYRKFTVVAPSSPLVPQIKALMLELEQRMADFEDARLNGTILATEDREDRVLPFSVFLDAPASAADDATSTQTLTLAQAPTEPEPRPSRSRLWLWGMILPAVVGGTVAAIILTTNSTPTREGSLATLRR